MEMQFFILGHLILLAICMGAGAVAASVEKDFGPIWAGFLFFILSEIIYWILHWFLVP